MVKAREMIIFGNKMKHAYYRASKIIVFSLDLSQLILLIIVSLTITQTIITLSDALITSFPGLVADNYLVSRACCR